MTGHKTRSVFERCHIVSDGDLEAAAQRLDESSTAMGKDSGKDGHFEQAAEMVNS